MTSPELIDAPQKKKAPRRLLRYSLRTLLLVTTVLGIWLGVKVDQARRQKAAVDTLRALGAQIAYEHQRVANGYDMKIELDVPTWARDLCSDDFFQTVRAVWFVDRLTEDRTQNIPYTFTDEDLACLADLPYLEELHIANAAITDDGLAHLPNPERLVDLSLWDTNVGDAFVRRLKGATRLQGLSLNNSRVTDAAVAGLGPFPLLKALRLRGTQTGDRALAAFADCSLVVLEVGMKTTDAGLAQFDSLQEIDVLMAKDCPITGTGFSALHFPNADTIAFTNCAITDETLPLLVPALANVRVVMLRGCSITDMGLKHLKHLGKTEIVVLSNTKIKGRELRQLSPLCGIAFLALMGCPLDDPDLKALEPLYTGVAPGVNLHLGKTAITDDDLAKLKNFTNLTHLTLSNTDASDSGLPHLYNLKKLAVLDLCHTRVTAEGVKQLKKAVPAALIAWDGDPCPPGWPW